jgi:AbiTii
MLTDEIISLLSEEKSSLSEALLKTKVFLYQIGKKELAEWVNHELNGYPEDIPCLPTAF